MVVDITLYRDRAFIHCVYNHINTSQWIEYPDGTKEKAIQMIDEWYERYKQGFNICNLTLSVHDHDYFSNQHF